MNGWEWAGRLYPIARRQVLSLFLKGQIPQETMCCDKVPPCGGWLSKRPGSILARHPARLCVAEVGGKARVVPVVETKSGGRARSGLKCCEATSWDCLVGLSKHSIPRGLPCTSYTCRKALQGHEEYPLGAAKPRN